MPRFADCARSRCPSFADLVLTLAAGADVDVDAAERALQRLGDDRRGREGDPEAAARGKIAGHGGRAEIAPPPAPAPRGTRLMLDVMLAQGTGGP